MEDRVHRRVKEDTDDNAKRIKDYHERLNNLFRLSMARIASTPDGQIVLNLIMRECGYHEPGLVLNTQTMDINVNSVIANEAIRGLYIKLRRMIPEQYLPDIEYMNIKKKAEELILDN